MRIQSSAIGAELGGRDGVRPPPSIRRMRRVLPSPGPLAALLAVALLITGACSSVTEGDPSTAPPISVTASPAAPSSTAPPQPTPTAAPSSTTPLPWVAPQHDVSIDAGGLTRDGTAFIPRGANYVQFTAGADRALDPDWFDPDALAAAFGELAARGYNTVRMFLDSCQCSSTPGGLSEPWLEVVAEAIRIAAANDVVLILTSNDLPDIRYGDAANAGASASIAGYRNAHDLTAAGHDAFVEYWGDILDGLVVRRAPLEAVLAWSILNEQWLFTTEPPLSLNSGVVRTAVGEYDMADEEAKRAMVTDNLRSLIERVVTEIKQRDPHGLVTMGFFAPQFPNPTGIGDTWYVDTAPLVADSALDLFDFHAYPGLDLTVAQQGENFGIDAAKPVIMGELGAFVDIYASVDAAALASQEWIAASCDAGWDGWIYWGYDRLQGVRDATWSFTDGDGELFEALAPSSQPDPCVPTLIDPNLARDGTATTSRSLAEELPSAAIDGNSGTQWGAGDFPTQWIEIALAEPLTVSAVRLLVAQFPEGETTHEVRFTYDNGRTEVVASVEGFTRQGEWLEVGLEESRSDVTAVRITTRSSPSWVAWSEIEVLR